MSDAPAHIPAFPLSKKQLLIAANVFFWVSFITFDTITTAAMVNGYLGFTFQRAIIHTIILFFLVYPNLYGLYPRYFSRGRYLKATIAAVLLLGLILLLRIGMDHLYLRWFLRGDFFNTPKGQYAYETLVNAGFLQNNQFVPSYYLGMTLGTVAVFFLTTPIVLVEDWYEKNRLSVQVLQHQLQLQEARVKFLKAQTDPHFLINALSGVYNLALLESKKIDVAILRLSELMAYLLGRGKEDRIALRHEVDFIRNFIEFHQAINPQPIDLAFELDVSAADLEAIFLPPMLLQPFFENALKHGNAADHPQGWIKSRLTVEGNRLLFSISNSLQPSKYASVSHHVGLQNVREKLALYFPEGRHELVIDPRQDIYEVNLRLYLT